MAVPRSPAPGNRRAAGANKEAPSPLAVSPRKRTKSPGVRVVGGRIYDSERGKTCHQCRQKTMDFAAACKQIRGGKTCPIKFCHKCLLNRYGESAEEVALLESWSCPKCRGVCNCSFCMKKKGQKPTGILIHTAKATGFTSVHELLDNGGSEVLIAANGLRSLSAGNPSDFKRGSTATKRRHGKENYHDEKDGRKCYEGNDDKVDGSIKKERVKASKKQRSLGECTHENVMEICDGNIKSETANGQEKSSKKMSLKARKLEKQPKIHPLVPKNSTSVELNDSQHARRPPKKLNCGMDISINTDEVKASDGSRNDILKGKASRKGQKLREHGADAEEFSDLQEKIVNYKTLLKEHKSLKCASGVTSEHDNVAHMIPQGTPLVEVAGSEWEEEDVGAALQFLEFCNAFSEVLDIKKGEPECVLRELARGRVRRGGLYSSVVKFHIKLLSFISKEMDDESITYSGSSGAQWFESLVKYINESDFATKMPLDYLKTDNLSYDNLDSSDKLKLLNLLCDTTLGKEGLRYWIDKENIKYIERRKEAKETIIAAKKKGNELKKKLKDDVARAMLSLKEGSLSIAEHENLISQIKAEADKAHAEMQEMMERLPKNRDNIKCNALRTEPMLLEGEGRIYWKLSGSCNNSKILLQDARSWDSVVLKDKWFAYNEEVEKAVDRHISFSRKKMQRIYKGSVSEVEHGI